MSVYHGKLLELVAVKKKDEKYFLHIRISFEQDIEVYLEIDEYTFINLINITNFGGRYKYRISFNTIWNETKKQHIGVLIQTYREQSEQICFPCSEEYINKLNAIKNLQHIHDLEQLDFIFTHPFSSNKKDFKDIEQKNITHAAPIRKYCLSYTRTTVTFFSILFITLFSCSSQGYLIGKIKPDRKLYTQATFIETDIEPSYNEDSVIKEEIIIEDTAQDNVVKDRTVKDDDIVKNNIIKDSIVKHDIVKDDDMAKDGISKDDMIKDHLVEDDMAKDNIVKDEFATDDRLAENIIPDQFMLPFVELDNPVSYNIPEGYVALTFDDGPSKYSKEIVDILKEYGIGGTFFFIGLNVKKYPEHVKYIHSNGYSIGTHSMNHSNLPTLSNEKQEKELIQSSQLIESLTGEKLSLFRPPYGAMNQNVKDLANQYGYKIILWNNDPEDWRNKDADAIVNHIKNTDISGSIILLHESQAVIDALPRIINYLKEQNLEIVSLK
ncbi:MAG: peptidoglycan-N-acetylglucosamine deacetylase [Epulopiscium sp.]|jgi:peptidoglycan/xylan/chitin deacetylase (PgdA/CDA1 family)|nr:polysaccharide deacetylase family protein [Defluviitaleaceae bacterium]MDK2788643.1 peptidoglycan-N-acetylglucosamine deacetylase [Candidatus Epulonipiscium sp.]